VPRSAILMFGFEIVPNGVVFFCQDKHIFLMVIFSIGLFDFGVFVIEHFGSVLFCSF